MKNFPPLVDGAYPAIGYMLSARHRELKTALEEFKNESITRISQCYGKLLQDLAAYEQTITSQAEARFAVVEEMLSGPCDKVLEWEWIPEAAPCRAISQAFIQRRIRLKELPNFEISAKEFFTKFARSTEDVVRNLAAIGFYLPPASKLFDHFLSDVVEGKKLIISQADLRKAQIPEDQIDLAYATAQKLIVTDADLQKFLPHGQPDSIPDKAYFLDIVNSLRGLTYKVVLPLNEDEERLAQGIRDAVETVLAETNDSDAVAKSLVSIADQCRPTTPSSEYSPEHYIDLYRRWRERLRRLEQGEEPMDTDREE